MILFNKIIFVNFTTNKSESCLSVALYLIAKELAPAFPRFDYLRKIVSRRN